MRSLRGLRRGVVRCSIEKCSLAVINVFHNVLVQLLIPDQLAVSGQQTSGFVLDLDFRADIVAEHRAHHRDGISLAGGIQIALSILFQLHINLAGDGARITLKLVHPREKPLEGVIKIQLERIERVAVQRQQIGFVAHDVLLYVLYGISDISTRTQGLSE